MNNVAGSDERSGRTAARTAAERLCAGSLLRLMVCVSAIRKTLTAVMPLAGNASWWVVPLCMLPGIFLFAGLMLTMRAVGAPTLLACMRVILGDFGEKAAWVLLSLWAVTEGTANLTTLITYFTEGVGAEGTQQTIALLTLAVLLVALDKEGLPRAAYFLRWIIRALALVLVLSSLPLARTDRLFPHLGPGEGGIRAAVRAGFSSAGALVLLLSDPQKGERFHLVKNAVPVLAYINVLAFVTVLCVSDTQLTATTGLAEAILLPLRYIHPAAHLLGTCLIILTAFLAIAGEARLTGESVEHTVSLRWRWYPSLAAGIFCAAQWIDADRLWSVLLQIDQFLFCITVVVAVIAVLAAIVWVWRRSRCGE